MVKKCITFASFVLTTLFLFIYFFLQIVSTDIFEGRRFLFWRLRQPPRRGSSVRTDARPALEPQKRSARARSAVKFLFLPLLFDRLLRLRFSFIFAVCPACAPAARPPFPSRDAICAASGATHGNNLEPPARLSLVVLCLASAAPVQRSAVRYE